MHAQEAEQAEKKITRHAARCGADQDGIRWAIHQYRQGIKRGMCPIDAERRALGELAMWVELFDRIDPHVASACIGADQFVRDAGMQA